MKIDVESVSIYEFLAKLAERFKPRVCGALGKDGRPCERHRGHTVDNHVSSTRVWNVDTKWKNGERA